MMTILGYLLVGLLIGTISGFLGIGGGVLIIPILMWIFGFTYPKAVGTTLACLVPPIGLLAAIEHYRQGNVELVTAIWVAAGFAVGGFVGAHIFHTIPPVMLRVAFGLLLIYVGARFILGTNNDARSATTALLIVAFSWLVYLGLKILGKHYRAPTLTDEIRRQQEKPPNEPEYYI